MLGDTDSLVERMLDTVMVSVGDINDDNALVESRISILGLILNENVLRVVGVTIICITVVTLSKSNALLIKNGATVVNASMNSEDMIAALDKEAVGEPAVGNICPDMNVAISEDGTTLTNGTEGKTATDVCIMVVNCVEMSAVLKELVVEMSEMITELGVGLSALLEELALRMPAMLVFEELVVGMSACVDVSISEVEGIPVVRDASIIPPSLS